MQVWLVTGGSGFIGRHLLTALASRKYLRVVALGRKCPLGWPTGRFLTADLEHPSEIQAAIRSAQPDVVLHTAGRTPPASADELYRTNTLATLHLLDAIRGGEKACRLVLTGSAAELGPVEESSLPVDENYPCQPADAYGLSKWLASCAALNRLGAVSIARVFNPIGPGQPYGQALGKFASQLALGANSLLVGDLDVRRDFVDVRDIAQALIVLAGQGRGGVYHVGTGDSHPVRDALDHLVRKSGRQIDIRIDPRLAHAAGPRDSRANIGRIVSETTWRPRIEWEKSLDDLWNAALVAGRPCH